ncbi:MAG TPA: patatin-like phospholipase family protein [Streptosporangiaceae bacterium]|jgi:NTE family protein
MGLKAVPGRSRPRVGLVLGAGGVLGAAWMTGALPALQERLPRPLGDLDLIVGTSAGSVLAAALRCGVGVDEMVAHQRGEAVGPLEAAAVDGLTGGPWPPAPQLRLGSARLMLAVMLAPHRVYPSVLASAWLPLGRANHGPLHDMVHALHCHAYGVPVSAEPPPWVRGETWIVAVDYRSGRRAVFGRAGAPPARLPDAVAASCSIPGWYQPAVIDGRRYVDGGVRSPTSLGMVARACLDEVFVLAPMASVVVDRPRMPHEVLERQLRAVMTMTLLREVRALRAAGIAVTVLTPGPEDLAVMGVNLMDPRRRRQVFEMSLITSAAALAGPAGRAAVA